MTKIISPVHYAQAKEKERAAINKHQQQQTKIHQPPHYYACFNIVIMFVVVYNTPKKHVLYDELKTII